MPNCISNRISNPAIGGCSVGRTALWPLAWYWSSLASPGPRQPLASSRPLPDSEVPGPETERGWDEAVMSSGLRPWPRTHTRHSTQHTMCCQQTTKTLDANGKEFMVHTGYKIGKRRYFAAHVNWSYLDIWLTFKLFPNLQKSFMCFRGANCSIYIFPTLNLHQSLNNIFPL